MAATDIAPPTPPGQPLPVIIECKAAVAVVVNADHDTGLLVLTPAGWPWLRIIIAPEVALDLSLHIVSRINDLRHDRRQ
jgi:hypothetical protein